MARKDSLCESINTAVYRVVLNHNETDKVLSKQLKQRDYSYQNTEILIDQRDKDFFSLLVN